MADPTPRILVVDDDVELANLIGEFLTAQAYEWRTVHDGPSGLAEALSGEYDLVLLDVMMPGFDGFELLRRLREKSPVPVLMLTAQGDPRQRIQGLDTGADDYLPKPFEPGELLARMRAILRRTQRQPQGGGQSLEIGSVRLDSRARTVHSAGEPVEVTSAEFDILEVLMRGAGRVVTRDEISQKLYSRNASPFDRSIDVHVSHLRKKLEGGGSSILTVRGAGYQFAVESVERS